MAEEFQEKTEEATPKKLADARKKGQVAKSQEFTSGILMICGVLVLYFFAAYFSTKMQHLFIAVLNNLQVPYDSLDGLTFWFRRGIVYVLITMLPLVVALTAVAFLVNVFQVGFTIAPEAIKPKWKNINCFHPGNYKRFFSVQALMRSALGVGKMALVAVVSYLVISTTLPEVSRLMNGRPLDIYFFVAKYAFLLGLFIAVTLLVLGILDLMFQKWKFKRDMRMTKQEVKDERKQTEGDIHVKSKMRSMMQAFAQSRMKDNVPHADVVIANPIHFAIAIKYDAQQMAAPQCVAKGARRMALVIKEIANEHDIPIVENPPLAQALYKGVDVGGFIPPDFYHAVAEVLAYVYRLNEKLGQWGQA